MPSARCALSAARWSVHLRDGCLRQDEPEIAYDCKWLLEAALVRVLRLQAADPLAG